jgi:Domain of unknown function (DUF1771)
VDEDMSHLVRFMLHIVVSSYLSFAYREALLMQKGGKQSGGITGWGRAHSAYCRGDGAAARQHSLKAAELQARAHALHEEATEQILHENNDRPGRTAWEVDLHGLHVREAIRAAEERCALKTHIATL